MRAAAAARGVAEPVGHTHYDIPVTNPHADEHHPHADSHAHHADSRAHHADNNAVRQRVADDHLANGDVLADRLRLVHV
ncbi:MAG TPA: hypothetical protein VF838_08015 [Trebonia sp.]